MRTLGFLSEVTVAEVLESPEDAPIKAPISSAIAPPRTAPSIDGEFLVIAEYVYISFPS